MTRLRYGFCLLMIAVGALIPLVGCRDGFTYTTVKGKVTLKNEPITAGVVVFVPSDEKTPQVRATGKISPDGTYVLTIDGKSGVPLGSYIACVQPQMRKLKGVDPPPRQFSDKYIDAADNPLKIQVVANPQPGAYDLVLTED